jgi:uncharacterized protein YndB with AHSA1/START domain
MTLANTAHEFTLSWKIAAPPADVFRAWTDPEQLLWYYNPDYPTPDEPIELDLRVGGVWRQRMIVDDDTAYVTGGVYREIVPDEKLVFSWGATGGWPELDPERLDDAPLVTVTLAGNDAGTELTLHVEVPAGMDERIPETWFAHIRDGWRETVDRLEAQLAARR